MKKYTKKDVNYILEQTRKKGRGGDTMLAHINPIEAMMLKQAGGSGTINPETGLREFSFWSNPRKATRSFFKKPKRALAETVGIASAVFGGPLGGALGGAAKEAILGRKPKDMLTGALKGGMYGTITPMVGNLAGQGLSKLGMNGIGQTLQNYGTNNMGSWLGNMGQMGQGIRGLGLPFTGAEKSLGTSDYLAGGSALSGMGGGKGEGVSAGSDQDEYLEYLLSKRKKEDEMGFTDKLLKNSKDFISKPKNLLALGTAGLSLYDRFNRPKEKSPEKEGKDAKAKLLAQRLTPKELADQEAYELEQERARRRIARKKFLPEERIDIEPIYNRVSSPQEYAQTGRWLNYYNNPQFTGNPIRF